MARPHRLQLQDGTYLLSFQGSEGMGLFVEEPDRIHFLELLALTASKHHVKLFAYALAGNTAELLAHTPRGNISAFAQGLQTGFARHLHHHYVHQGPVMQGRYKSKLVDPETALVTVAAWIHTLPVRENPALNRMDQKRKALTRSGSTSLGAYQNPEHSPAFLDTIPVLKALGGRVNSRPERFQALCETLALEPDPDTLTMLRASPLAIGSTGFLEEIRALHDAVRKGRGNKHLRVHGRKKRGIPQSNILEAVQREFHLDPKKLHERRRDDLGRPALAYFLYNHGESPQREIAKRLGLTSAAAVSLQIRRLLIARSENTELDKRLKRIERALNVPT